MATVKFHGPEDSELTVKDLCYYVSDLSSWIQRLEFTVVTENYHYISLSHSEFHLSDEKDNNASVSLQVMETDDSDFILSFGILEIYCGEGFTADIHYLGNDRYSILLYRLEYLIRHERELPLKSQSESNYIDWIEANTKSSSSSFSATPIQST